MNAVETELHNILSAISKSWLNNNPEEMKSYLHPDIVMKLPRFSQDITGSEALLDGFKEFCTNAQVLEYSESDEQINGV